jgi:hypothetical protein
MKMFETVFLSNTETPFTSEGKITERYSQKTNLDSNRSANDSDKEIK